MKRTIVTASILICAVLAAADDPSEKGVPTSPLTIYSGGLGAGAFLSLNEELKRESNEFLKLSFINSIYFKDYLSLFIDINWFGPGSNFGADLGMDFLLADSDFKPFMGMGVGAQYFDKKGDFGDNFGPMVTLRLGFLLDVTDRLQVRLCVPYYFVANETRDNTAGMEIGLLFSDRFRKVRKLNYNDR